MSDIKSDTYELHNYINFVLKVKVTCSTKAFTKTYLKET